MGIPFDLLDRMEGTEDGNEGGNLILAKTQY